MNKLFGFFYNYLKTRIGWWPLIFAILMCCKTLGFSFFPTDLVSYIILIIAAIQTLRRGMEFDKLCLIFILYIPLAILMASPPPMFNSWMRYGLFAILYLAVSPLVINTRSKDFRIRVFRGTILCCMIIGAISFICYFLGINLMRNLYTGGYLDYQQNTAGTFGGITNHSMLLGPISGVGVITSTYYALKYNKYFWILTGMCGGALLFAASRSSLIATIGGELILFYFSTENVGKNLKRAILVGIVLVVTNPLWNGALNGIMAKNQGSIYSGINTSSRTPKWDIRLEEWEDSPIYGIGFCAVSEKDPVGFGGIIEPGSSWLAVLSMTGSIGFILFCLIYFRGAKNSLMYRTPEGGLLSGILILLGLHMIAEGHIFSGGSCLCFLVWLSIGCSTDYDPFEIENE